MSYEHIACDGKLIALNMEAYLWQERKLQYSNCTLGASRTSNAIQRRKKRPNASDKVSVCSHKESGVRKGKSIFLLVLIVMSALAGKCDFVHYRRHPQAYTNDYGLIYNSYHRNGGFH